MASDERATPCGSESEAGAAAISPWLCHAGRRTSYVAGVTSRELRGDRQRRGRAGARANLLTGKTGAGKSILVDALALLLGGKASSDVVRHGAEKAVGSCVFEATDEAERILETHGIDAGEGGILLRREIATSGKGRVFVNNQPATAAVLKLLAPGARADSRAIGNTGWL